MLYKSIGTDINQSLQCLGHVMPVLLTRDGDSYSSRTWVADFCDLQLDLISTQKTCDLTWKHDLVTTLQRGLRRQFYHVICTTTYNVTGRVFREIYRSSFKEFSLKTIFYCMKEMIVSVVKRFITSFDDRIGVQVPLRLLPGQTCLTHCLWLPLSSPWRFSEKFLIQYWHCSSILGSKLHCSFKNKPRSRADMAVISW